MGRSLTNSSRMHQPFEPIGRVGLGLAWWGLAWPYCCINWLVSSARDANMFS